jgi:hypothetical protein
LKDEIKALSSDLRASQEKIDEQLEAKLQNTKEIEMIKLNQEQSKAGKIVAAIMASTQKA